MSEGARGHRTGGAAFVGARGARGRGRSIESGDPTAPVPAARPGFEPKRRGSNAATRRHNTKVATTLDDGVVEERKNDIPIDRGLGLRRALSDETQSRPFQPLGGEVLHIGWLRTESENGKVTRSEGIEDRHCIEALLDHYTVAKEEQEELLNRVERGWSDVTFALGEGYFCRLQRFSEFDTLTLSGPGNPDDDVGAPFRPWQWMIPDQWLSKVPGRVFLCLHVMCRHTDSEQYQLLDDNDLWNELQLVTNAVGWEERTKDGGMSFETLQNKARTEALAAISDQFNEASGEKTEKPEEEPEVAKPEPVVAASAPAHVNGKNGVKGVAREMTASLGAGAVQVVGQKGAPAEVEMARGAHSVATAVRPLSEEEEEEEERDAEKEKEMEKAKAERKEKVKKATAAFGTEEWLQERRRRENRKAKKATAEANDTEGAITGKPSNVPSQWSNWGTQIESSRIVGFDAGGGVTRFYANYHLDREGAMLCLFLTPRGASVVRAARQLQRFFTIEQYRLLTLARLPAAKSRYPVLAKLNDQYECVAKAIRRMNASTGSAKRKLRRYAQQQEFLEKITDLEQATAQELARAKSEVTIARAYCDIIYSRFEEAQFKPLGGEVRFLPLFVQKRLDPAVSTINSVSERAQILSDALQRTTGLLATGVEVRMQKEYERIAQYGLVFTVLGVLATLASAVSAGGPLHSFWSHCCAWLMSHAGRFKPLLSFLGL